MSGTGWLGSNGRVERSFYAFLGCRSAERVSLDARRTDILVSTRHTTTTTPTCRALTFYLARCGNAVLWPSHGWRYGRIIPCGRRLGLRFRVEAVILFEMGGGGRNWRRQPAQPRVQLGCIHKNSDPHLVRNSLVVFHSFCYYFSLIIFAVGLSERTVGRCRAGMIHKEKKYVSCLHLYIL